MIYISLCIIYISAYVIHIRVYMIYILVYRIYIYENYCHTPTMLGGLTTDNAIVMEDSTL